MSSKGLWRHVENNAIMSKPYTVVDRVPVTSDGKTLATEEHIKTQSLITKNVNILCNMLSFQQP